MKREIIKVTEFEIAPLCWEYYWESIDDKVYNEYFDEDGESIKHHFSNDFQHINEIVTDYDLEKSYEIKDTIIRRITDGKYFKCTWTNAYYDNYYSDEIVETFPKEITTIIYE